MAARRTRHRDPLALRPLLIGMVHLAPLPGTPRWRPSAPGAVRPWLGAALEDAQVLATAGFGALLVENLGDAPYAKDSVAAETVAALAVACAALRAALPDMPLGVNVLRNDAAGALAIAAAADLDFIRVNVLAGAALTDQGVIEGRAHEVLRLRARLAPHVRLLADLRVKHARPLAERPLAEEAHELVARAGADAVIVTGVGTGLPVDVEHLLEVRRALPGHPLLVGSGTTARTVAGLLAVADGVIVGSALKQRGRVTAARAAAFCVSALPPA